MRSVSLPPQFRDWIDRLIARRRDLWSEFSGASKGAIFACRLGEIDSKLEGITQLENTCGCGNRGIWNSVYRTVPSCKCLVKMRFLYASSCQLRNGVMFRLIYDRFFPNWSGNLVRFGYFCPFQVVSGESQILGRILFPLNRDLLCSPHLIVVLFCLYYFDLLDSGASWFIPFHCTGPVHGMLWTCDQHGSLFIWFAYPFGRSVTCALWVAQAA